MRPLTAPNGILASRTSGAGSAAQTALASPRAVTAERIVARNMARLLGESVEVCVHLLDVLALHQGDGCDRPSTLQRRLDFHREVARLGPGGAPDRGGALHFLLVHRF